MVFTEGLSGFSKFHSLLGLCIEKEAIFGIQNDSHLFIYSNPEIFSTSDDDSFLSQLESYERGFSGELKRIDLP